MASAQTIEIVDGVDEAEELPRLAVRGMQLSIDHTVILDDLFFEVAPGEILGILGPNGSGKSSLLRCITGIWQGDRGTVWMDGVRVDTHDRRLRATSGVVFQDPSLDDHLTAHQNLILGAALFGITGKEAKNRAQELLEFMELTHRAEDLTKTFSGGMRRRLELARALIHRPKILFLDEPSTGLDPVAFDKLWHRLEALRKIQGLTIVVATHRADEAEKCDRLLVMNRGHVVANGTPAALLGEDAEQVIELLAHDAGRVEVLLREELKLNPRLVADRVEVEVSEAHQWIPRIVEAFPPETFQSVALRKPSLSDAFFKLTGRELTDDVEDDEGGTES